ncbi:MAG: tetratricopeptide repeat protein, partial [Rhodospirillales bacterium]
WVIKINHGNPQTQFDLAMKLIQGTWLPKNIETARFWLKNAARKKHVEANYVLGKAYLDGSLNEKDPSMGRWKLFMAAEKNHADAQLILGQHYADNLHEDRYGIKALYWLWRAEKSGKVVNPKLIETVKASMTEQDKVFAKITIESGKTPFPP